MLRVATGIVTTYMVDVVVVWVLAYQVALYSTKFAQPQHILPLSKGHQQSQTVFRWSHADCKPDLSSKYGDVSLTLQGFSQSCEKLTDAIKHSGISDTSELLIIHFKWHGIITQLATLFNAFMYIIHILHTCYS